MRNIRINDEILVQAAKKYGTPCLCYEENEINYWRKTLKNAIPQQSKLIYSVKASPSVILLQNYINNGMLFETASSGELSLLISLGVEPDKIWVSGQGKSADYVTNALKYGVSHFNIESENELNLIAPLIKGHYNNICCIRINPNNISDRSILQIAGKASAFGVDENKIQQLLQNPYSDIINGIFVYYGSQYFSADSIINNTEKVFRLAIDFHTFTGRIVKAIDFGGGFGVPENDDINELNLGTLHEGLNTLFEKYTDFSCFSSDTEYCFESGRFLAARTACLITSVMDVKESMDKKFVITNGGINYIGVKQAEYRLYPPYIRHIGKNKAGNFDKYCIMGNTCTPIDQTHPEAVLDNPSIGDYICILDCGAYSLNFSPQHFNGFYSIPEILHSNNFLAAYTHNGTHEELIGKKELVPIGTGQEIKQVFIESCPVDSDEVKSIIIASETIKRNGLRFFIYDMSQNGTEAVILLKILKKHYGIVPNAVFSDFLYISEFTEAECLKKDYYNQFSSRNIMSDYFAMLTGAEFSDNDISQAATMILNSGVWSYMKIESELIESMELDFYDYYLHHIPDLQRSFDFLCDIVSKECYIEYLRTILENDFWRLPVAPLRSKYWGYDLNPYKKLYEHLDNEKWLNIGACNGDTIVRYFSEGYSASKIYAVDSDANALSLCQANLNLINVRGQDQVSYHNVLFGCRKDEVKIDDMFSNIPLTLINMDIEGAEQNTVMSAKNVIKINKPVLAICVYHKPEDIFKLISIIHNISTDYSFYLRKYPNYPYHRYNSKEELVLYAIPIERKPKLL